MPIRTAGSADIEPALAVIGAAFGLVVRDPSVHTLVARAQEGNLLVAERDGRIVGTGASVGFGRTGWIGGVAVADDARGAGLGRALTEAALSALGPRETVLLLASDVGRPIYERLGFEGEGRYRVFMSPGSDAPRDADVAAGAAASPGAATSPGAPASPVPAPLRALTRADREAVLALDARVTGERRSLGIDAGLSGGVGTLDLSAVALRPPWPARPILAPDPAEGAALLAAVMEPGLRLAVPEANESAVSSLLALGADERPGVLRMRRGASVAWRPAELWGVFSLFFG